MKMKNVLLSFLIIITFTLTSCNYMLVDERDVEKVIKETIEKSYFNGQKDAINGKIIIKLNSDSVYIWTQSCWDDGTQPTYNPTFLDSKQNVNKGLQLSIK